MAYVGILNDDSKLLSLSNRDKGDVNRARENGGEFYEKVKFVWKSLRVHIEANLSQGGQLGSVTQVAGRLESQPPSWE